MQQGRLQARSTSMLRLLKSPAADSKALLERGLQCSCTKALRLAKGSALIYTWFTVTVCSGVACRHAAIDAEACE